VKNRVLGKNAEKKYIFVGKKTNLGEKKCFGIFHQKTFMGGAE
jgi:hypothetical protein